MLSAKNIHKKYGPVEVLKGVDIHIDAGEIVSIVGPSGSGKSTLLHILGTLDAADQGYVDISGVRINSRPEIPLLPVPWSKRLVHLLVDGILIVLLSSLILYFYSGTVPGFSDYVLWPVLLSLVSVAVAYYFFFEWAWGRTPGKLLTGSKLTLSRFPVKPGAKACLLRTLGRLIPLDVFSFFAARPVGWHDAFGDTLVIDKQLPWQEHRDLTPNELAAFRNKRIGFVFQFHHLLPEFTALENVCIAGWIAQPGKKEVRERAIQLLTALGLNDRLHNKPGQLSGGEQQRVAVARALINKPDIVFADEPTGNLDTANAKELHQLFFELRREFQQTFLIVTHNEELAQLSDRTLTMKDGRIIEQAVEG